MFWADPLFVKLGKGGPCHMRCDPVSWHGNMDKGSDNNEIEKKKGLNGKIF